MLTWIRRPTTVIGGKADIARTWLVCPLMTRSGQWHLEPTPAACQHSPMGASGKQNLVVRGFAISIDGFGAGPSQDVKNPLGIGGTALHEWALGTRTFQKRLLGKDDGATGPDDDFAARSFENIGAWILGRNMFGPIRGPWPDDSWKGWWGDEPPYHCPVYVVTHHARAPIAMKGGTVFHFVTEGIHAALKRAWDWRTVRTSDWVAASQRYGNISRRGSSVKCTSRSHRRSLVPARIFFPDLISCASVTGAQNMSPRQTPHTSS